MVMYSYRMENYEKWLAGFAVTLNTTVNNNVLTLPPHIGKGTIQAYNLSPHFSYAIMNFQLEHDLELQREASDEKRFSLTFNQVDISRELQIGLHHHIVTDKRPFRNDIFLSHLGASLYIKLSAGSQVKRLAVICSHELAGQYLPAEFLAKLETFAHANTVADNPYFVNLPHRETLKDIFEMKENDPLGKIRRLAHIIHLTEKFLHSFQRQQQPTAPRSVKKNDLENMQHIERILTRKLEGFPSLESLAHEVYMSTSKLKNLFKQVYGYTLYDYYNKNRLQRAKEMLLTGQVSIKQAGSDIGFSNLSHFAKAFKKEFGVLPRDLVRGR
jgi:AraC-like DNA-binding protein